MLGTKIFRHRKDTSEAMVLGWGSFVPPVYGELNDSKSIRLLGAHIVVGGIAMTMVMTVVPLFGAGIGLTLGLARFKVFALLPAILIVAAGAIGGGLAAGFEFRFIALAVLVAVASSQIAYLAGFLAASSTAAKHLRVRHTSWF
jgi:hypothetical protein